MPESMSSNVHAPAHELLQMLSEQRAMVEELSQLTERQAGHISEGRTERLLETLAQRQAIIDAFTASQNRLAACMAQMDDVSRGADAETRIRIKSLLNEISERLTEVMRRDEQDQTSLRSSRDQVKGEMSSLAASRQARGAYGGASLAATRFADQRG